MHAWATGFLQGAPWHCSTPILPGCLPRHPVQPPLLPLKGAEDKRPLVPRWSGLCPWRAV